MYKIAIRTYKRSDIFPNRTYKFLKAQTDIDLSEQLYIFVADENEKILYEEALSGQPYKAIIVGLPGLKEVTDFMLNYFGDGQKVFFMDDDFFSFYEFPGHPLANKIVKESTNMGKYLEEGFATIEEEGISSFTFRNMQNALFLDGSPYKEIRPFFVYGGAFGIIANKELHSSTYAHGEDSERTAKIIDHDGGTLVFNWAGVITHSKNEGGYGTMDGGMQVSGDRGEGEARKEFTRKIAFDLYENTSVGKYFKEPFYKADINAYDFKLKPINSLRKHSIRTKRW